MQIMYDKPDTYLGTVTASYSGRISAVKWMTRDGSNNKTNERSYVYNYDQLGRDTSAWYAERSAASLSTFNINNHGFDEYGITYDAGGNIKTLKRTSSSLNASSHTLADNLVYTYDTALPYRLDNVADNSGNTTLGFRNVTGSTGNYTYDSDGNLTGDPYKGLNLLYNTAVNRVDSIMTTQTAMNGAYITYTYDAAGSVLRKQVYSTGTSLQSQTDYIGGFVYTTASGATTLTYIQNTEGRLMNTGSGSSVTLTPEYVITDNQGNARFSFQDNGTGIVIRQENSYYSFGEVLANSPVATPTTSNINLYNGGSEWQNEFSNLPDYHQTFFRNYDPAIGRFIAVDPKPESAESMTVYQYAGNDPFNNNDPGGDKLAQPQAYQYMAYYSQLASTEGNPDMNLSNSFLQQFAPQGGASGSTGGDDYSGFWSAFLADVQVYFAANGEDADINLDSKQISGEYSDFLQNGDDGVITRDFTNSDAVIQPMFGGDGILHVGRKVGVGGTDVNSVIGGYYHKADGTPTTINDVSGELYAVNSHDITDVAYGNSMMQQHLNAFNQSHSENDEENQAGKMIDPVDRALTIASTPSLWNEAYANTLKLSVGLKWLGKFTGTATIVTSTLNGIQDIRNGNWGAGLWNIGKAAGTGAFMWLGGEEAELLWNTGVLAIDLTKEAFKK